ncbi:uncharacterized protein LOC110822395 [Carica papaya]|uniref:uncharacterized protein LOC110822395 n=1 Tax=Carica papaya TaxID=3649 RepID=UPI000B8CA008|nr:uncharacterized protein LOC110822395 [Carica papaya]
MCIYINIERRCRRKVSSALDAFLKLIKNRSDNLLLMMDDEKAKELDQLFTETLPVLPRLDRLDRLVEALEGKQWLSEKQIRGVERKEEEKDEDEGKQITLSSALEQVHHKGTLMDRITMLENRVLQLSLKYLEDMGKSSINPKREAIERPVEDAISHVQHATATHNPVERMEKVGRRKEKRKQRKWLEWLRRPPC